MTQYSAEEVLAMVDDYCEQKGNPVVAKAIRAGYEKTGKMPQAALKSLKLQEVTVYEPLD